MELYGKFKEKSYVIEAYMPSNPNEIMEFQIKVLKKGKLIKEIKMPLDHKPIFGIDILDRKNLKIKIEELLKTLP